MRYPLAAALTLLLTASASAQIRTITTPFGVIDAAWSSALHGLTISGGPLFDRAFPPAYAYSNNASRSPVMQNLAPVAAALQQRGVFPETFSSLPAAVRRTAVESALIEADGLVAQRADALLRRATVAAGQEAMDQALRDIEGMSAYWGYMQREKDLPARETLEIARLHLLEQKSRAIAQAADKTADALSATSLPTANSTLAAESKANPNDNRATLDEISALE